MSTRSVSSRPRASSRPRRRPARARRQVVRRRLLLLGAVIAAAIAVPALIAPFADQAVQEVTLPLRHDDIIRQQAEDKDLDAALIAGVIFTESHFRDQTSRAGARGALPRRRPHPVPRDARLREEGAGRQKGLPPDLRPRARVVSEPLAG